MAVTKSGTMSHPDPRIIFNGSSAVGYCGSTIREAGLSATYQRHRSISMGQ
jgi:hypothetical protein